MPSYNHQEDHFWRNLATHSVLIILCSVLIVWLMPNKIHITVEPNIGAPWQLEDLISDIEFDLMKSEETIAQEKADKVRKEMVPSFNLIDSVEQRAEKELIDTLNAHFGALAPVVKSYYVHRLHEIYKKGVVDQTSYDDVEKRYDQKSIRIIRGNQSVTKTLGEVYSEQTANEYFHQADSQVAVAAHHIDLPYIQPNLEYDDSTSLEDIRHLEELVAVSDRKIQQGERIIEQGVVIDEPTSRAIKQYYEIKAGKFQRENGSFANISGRVIYVLLLFALFTTYLILFRRQYFKKVRHTLMLYSLITLFPLLAMLVSSTMGALPIYILPFAMVPIFVRIFMDSRTAFVAHATMVMIGSMILPNQPFFFIVQIVAGMTAIYALRDMSKRSDLFKAALMVTLCSAVMFTAMSLIYHAKFPARTAYIYLAINGILLLLAYPLMFVVEKSFNFTSSVTLFELSDTNKDLLRHLSEVAPGTFQHSITVGNLASEIAKKIGADSLLVRTGALYHDIGKMVNPVFFTENQAGVNPHDKLTEKESASIIISHVIEGLRLAEEKRLPDVIKNFITTHHGTGVVKYFYVKYKNAHPKEEVDEEAFSYPGPNPFTREQAILMMADTVEAASRSLSEYTDEKLSELINRLIDGQVSAGFFTDCPITFLDITIAKKVLLENLKSIYHTRIKYPELNQEARKGYQQQKSGKKRRGSLSKRFSVNKS